MIPFGDTVLRTDLHSISSVTGPTGIRRLMADDTSDGHADRFWSMALGAAAAQSRYQPLGYMPVPPGAEFEDREIKITAGFGARRRIW